MIDVKHDNGEIRVRVEGSKEETSKEIYLLIRELVNHPVLHHVLDAALYNAGGIEYLNQLVSNYAVWIAAGEIIKEGDNNAAK